MTKEYRKLTDWNPKKGDVFTKEGGLQLNIVSEGRAAFSFWGEGLSDPLIYFTDSYSLVSRATPEEVPTGKWIGWNGGECPVHSEAVVEVTYGEERDRRLASVFDWNHDLLPIVAYRVIKEYVEAPKPREFWICLDTSEVYFYRVLGAIHVQEILEGEEDV
tara:strand:- start:2679 stop:3161 length:483 start_codon:yes stop_codon:yes gene_type:complete